MRRQLVMMTVFQRTWSSFLGGGVERVDGGGAVAVGVGGTVNGDGARLEASTLATGLRLEAIHDGNVMVTVSSTRRKSAASRGGRPKKKVL